MTKQYRKDNYGNDFKCCKCDKEAEYDHGPNPETGIPDATGLFCFEHWYENFRKEHPEIKFVSIDDIINGKEIE